jgi:NDP-sugar pyrophosphorylase family protein
MKAILFPYQHAEGLHALRFLASDFLMPIAGKSPAEHLVEFCISAEIRDIHMLVEDDPAAAERYFGKGERWGANILVQSVDNTLPFIGQLTAAVVGIDGPICCFPANLLVSGDFSEIVTAVSEGGLPAVTGKPGEPGFFVVSADTLQEVQKMDENADYGSVLDLLRNRRQPPVHCSIQTRLITSLAEYLSAQQAILDGSWPGVRIAASRQEDGIWIDDHVTLSSQVKLIPPLLIGHRTRIDGAGTIGPNAVIGPFCLINDTDLIEESALLPGTVTGPHTELSQLIVHGSRIVNVRRGVCVTSPDAFILGDLPEIDDKEPARSVYLPMALVGVLLLVLIWFFFLR